MGYVPSEVKYFVWAKKPAAMFFHQNVRSLTNKTDEQTTLIHSFGTPITVIMLTETWLTPASYLFQFPGHKYFFRSRQIKQGRGVAILLKDDIVVEPVDVVYTDISDHLGIILLVSKIHHVTRKSKQPVYVQSITSPNIEAFRRAIAQQTWDSV